MPTIDGTRLERFATIESTNISERQVNASLSSEEPYSRFFGTEILLHGEENVDLSRAEANGLPLIWNHDTDLIIGRVRDIRIDNAKLRGVLHFARNDEAETKFTDVKDGVITDISIGYRINKWEESEDSDEIRATLWTPMEVSLVSVPADHTVGIGRSANLGEEMKDESGKKEAVAADPVIEITRSHKILTEDAERRARVAERARLSEIDEIFELPSVQRSPVMRALRAQAIDEGWTVDVTRKHVMEAMSEPFQVDLGAPAQAPEQSTTNAPAVRQSHRGGLAQPVQAGTDAVEKLGDAIERVILVRGKIETDKSVIAEVRASGMHDHSLFDMGSAFLRSANQQISGKSKRDIAGMMLRAGSHTNADFPSILANVATKATLKGWEESPTTWQQWCNSGSLPDFKQATIAGLGAYPDLDTIPRSGGPYLQHSVDDIHELAQLATYGGLFSVGRQTLIDDDLNTLTKVPMRMGEAAARKVNGLAYYVLTNGTSATLTQDSTALFDASTHGNYVTAGAAPSVTTLNAGFTAMATQQPPARSGETSTAYLNTEPRYLIVPRALEVTSRILATSQYDPAGTTASVSRRDSPNPFQGRIEVVADALLDASNASGWYLAAAKNGPVETVTVFFLNGIEEPYIEETDHGAIADGITWKVRIDAVAAALDFRGLYYNDGVT